MPSRTSSMTTRGRAKPVRKTGNTRPVVVGGMHAKRSRKSWRNVLLHGRRRVPSRFYRGSRKHQRNRYVIRPRRTVHVRHVSPRDEVAFARHDQELAGSSREVCPSKHL